MLRMSGRAYLRDDCRGSTVANKRQGSFLRVRSTRSGRTVVHKFCRLRWTWNGASESYYASKPHRFHESILLYSRRVRTRGRRDAIARCALGMRLHARASVHFVTHSCIFRSERFATRASLSRTAYYVCARASQPESFRRCTRTVAK